MNALGFSMPMLSMDPRIVESLGWTLVHFLWQGSIVAGCIALVDVFLARRRPQARYLAGCLALIVMFALPFATFVATNAASNSRAAARLPRGAEMRGAGPAFLETAPYASLLRLGTPPAVARASGAHGARRAPFTPPHDPVSLAVLLPWFVALWAFGVALLSLRLLGGWWLVTRLGRSAHNVPIEAWRETMTGIAHRMGVSRPVRLVRSALVAVPTTIGWLRPVILLPASTLTGLHPTQIEAILAHELAHIRRHDYVVNILQTMIEIVLFYHPAVWWVSRRVREERELCCDDLAVRASGDPVTYAKALCELETLRGQGLPMALAASGGSLVTRIARLLGASQRPHLEVSRVMVWVMIALLVTLGGAARSAVRVNDRPLAQVVRERVVPAAAIAIRVAAVQAPQAAALATQNAVALAGEAMVVATDVASDVVSNVATVVVANVATDVATSVAVTVAPKVACETPAKEANCPKTEDASGAQARKSDSDEPSGYESTRATMAHYSFQEWQRLSESGVSATYVANLAHKGYPDLTVEELVLLAQHGVTSAYAGALRELIRDPEVPSLVKLADHGVSSRYAIAMSAALGHLDADDLVQLADHGVSTEFVSGMQELDLGELNTQDLIRLANSGVTLEWFSALKWMGYSDLTVERAIQLANAGVTADYASSLRILNRHKLSLDDLRELRNQGVDVGYVAPMLGLLRKDLSVEQLIKLRNQGVTVQFVAAMNALGYSDLTAEELIQLRQQGVDPQFVATMRGAGYTRLSVTDLVRLTQNGVSAEFVDKVREAGLGLPDVDDLIRMRQRGIPTD